MADPGLTALDVEIGGQTESIIVHSDGNRRQAWYNTCPHQGRRLDYVPGKFLVDQGRLVCAAHGAAFRLEDGLCVSGPCVGQSLRGLRLEDTGTGCSRVSDPAA